MNEDDQRTAAIDAAFAQLNNGQFAEAVKLLEPLITANGQDAEARSFLGLARIKCGDRQGLDDLKLAESISPDVAHYKMNLGLGYLDLDELELASAAFEDAHFLSESSTEILLPWAEVFIRAGRLQQALEILRKSTDPSPANRRRRAQTLAQLGTPATAVTELQQAVGKSTPTRSDRMLMAQLALQLQRFDDAQLQARSLYQAFPDDVDVSLLMSRIHEINGDLDEANAVLESAYEKAPENAAVLARLLDGDSAPSGAVAAAEQMLSSGNIGGDQKRILAFSLARAFDQQKIFDKAWHMATLANSLPSQGAAPVAYDINVMFETAKRYFSSAETLDHYDNEPDMIYLIGPPRSGGTLLQSVISATGQITSVGERAALLPWLFRFTQMAEAEGLKQYQLDQGHLKVADLSGLQEMHADATGFSDKTPHHVAVAGLLKQLYPKAKFIDNRRNPIDVLVSVYFRDFPAAFGFSRSADDIAAFLKAQRQMVSYWQGVGVDIIEHDHDAFTRDPAVKGQQLLSALGLPWSDSYLDTAKRDATVQTFSARQVREEITSRGFGNGQNYVSFLGGAPELLADL